MSVINGSLRDLADPAALRYGISRLPTFRPEVYLRLNSDLTSETNAIEHFIAHGLWEGRPYCSEQSVVAAIRRLSPSYSGAEPLPEQDLVDALVHATSQGISIYVHSTSDTKVRLRAELTSIALMSRGIPVHLHDETHSIDVQVQNRIFFAPHEFFFRQGGERWLSKGIVSSAILYPTQPLHSIPGARILPLLFSCRAVIDDNEQNCSLYACCDIPFARYLPLPLDEESIFVDNDKSDALSMSVRDDINEKYRPAESWSSRPLDLCYFGSGHSIRDEVFLKGAANFARLRCFINYPERDRSSAVLRARGPQRVSVQNVVARNSKILLNIDVQEIGSLAWYESCLLGFWNRTLIVSRPLYPHPIFRPGEHFLEETSRNIPDLVSWLVSTEEGIELGRKIVARAYMALSSAYMPDHAVEPLIKLLHTSRAHLHANGSSVPCRL
ncbi:hypothetical protein BHAOGJBA_6300 [Methylobacterium hispanicum]|uniref:Glycosyl transferase CAP10 domain-containing protein n=1 Tax=Methylobacterium hispanicum TaxID=270350 RepID=A0AAV4ZXU8_9HYPH|nr:hypothetical protein BHAOGJBA_6300 [Methylobacterium hispanicum]